MEGTTAVTTGRGPAVIGAVHVQVLGPIRATRPAPGSGPQPVELGGPRPRRLMLAMAVDAGRPIPMDRLADRIWPDRLPADPRAALHTLISRLRTALGGGAITTDVAGYTLVAAAAGDGAPIELDALTFARYVGEAEAEGVGLLRRLELLDAALELWRGPAFDEVAGEEWAIGEIERLHELRLVALERRFDTMLALGRHVEALPALSQAVREHPLRDRLVGHHMLALFRAGRQAEAARAYQAHRSRLGQQLGLEPGIALAELDRRIVSGDATLLGDGSASSSGRSVRGYRLAEQLGQGAFAVVFRASQPSLDREVAVKVIRAELADHPEFVRRFEAEAQLVASLEHPHVVPLYDFWREPGRACLVFRYLRGGSLASRLRTAGPLQPDHVRTLIAQVGAALAAAHQAGVVHRDVRPANVFLDESDNFYLGDFGIAAAGHSPQDDIRGLAATVRQALTGELDPEDAIEPAGDGDARRRANRIASTSGPEVPPAAAALLTAAESGAATRSAIPGVADFAAALARALDTPSAVAGTPAGGSTTNDTADPRPLLERNPYKGLRPFAESDADDFKGRDRLVRRLVGGFRRSGIEGRLAVVVGPSGIGKSSVVRAGLLPAIRGGALTGSQRWLIATMAPGRAPFAELATALLHVATTTAGDLAAELHHDPDLPDDPDPIARVVRALVADAGAGALLLVIDQFEELFTLCDDELERRRFLHALEAAITDPACPLRLVLTLRADFYDRPLRYGSFAQLIEPGTVTVTALTPDELEAAIVEPAASVGCAFAPGLVSEIVADVGDQPGALPLLQHALNELWKRRRSGLFTAEAYRSSGGVAGALAATAERLFLDASGRERAALRRAFGRLVTLGDGAEDTRRRVPLTELGPDAALTDVLSRFGHARLLSFDRDQSTREPTVEVAHEALLRAWPRLRAWLDEDRDGLRVLRHLTAAAAAWEASGRDAGELYRGSRLEAAETWADEQPDRLNDAETAFLAASRHRREEEHRAQRRHVRRLRCALAAVAVVAAVAAVAGVLAGVQQRRANAAAAEAETRRLVADAAAMVGENRDVALLLASEAYRRDPGPQTLAGLQRVLTSTGPYLGTYGAGQEFLGVEVLDDGTIAGLTAAGVTFYDPETAAPIRTVPLEVEVPARVGHDVMAVQADLLAVGTTGGTVTLIDGAEVRILTVSTHAVRSLAFGAGVIVVGTNDGTVHLLELETGQQRWATQLMPQQTYREVLGDEAWYSLTAPLRDFYTGFEPLLLQTGPGNIVVEPSGRVVASAMLHLVALDGGTGEVAARRQNPVNPQHGVPFALSLLSRLPDGALLEAGSFKAVRFSPDLDVLEDRAVPTGRMDTNVIARSVALGSDGQPYWGLSNGQLARGTTVGPLDGTREVTGLTAVLALASAEDGTLLAAGRGGIVAWGVQARTLLGVAVPDGGNAGTSISPDGTLLYASTAGSENTSAAYDLSGQAPIPLRRDHNPDFSYAVSPDPLGRYVDAFRLGELRYLDRTTSEHVATLPDASFTAFSFDGARLAVVTFDSNGLQVFDAQTFEPVSPPLDISAWTGGFRGATPGFSTDGAQLFAVFQATGETVVMDTATWAVVRTIDPSDHHGIIAARFGRDGNTLVTLGTDGSIALRDPRTWAFERTLNGGVSGTDSLDPGLYLSADGRYLLTTRDGKPRLWDLPTATLIGTFPHRAGLTATGNDLGEQLRLVTLDGGYALSWNLDVTAWPTLACRAAGRNLTEDEWRQFGPRSTPYRATCPQWPSGV